MTLQTKLGLAFAGTLAVAMLAGCPKGGPLTTVTPSPSVKPTPTPYVRTSAQQVIFTNVYFTTTGHHWAVIKNLATAPADLTPFWLSFHPTTTSNEATSSILDAATGNKLTTPLAAGATISISLDNSSTSGARTEWTSGTVQYGAGGALALFSTAASSSTSLSDFVQWGRTGTKYEATAASASLWTVGTTIATQSLTANSTTSIRVLTEGKTGASNWTF